MYDNGIISISGFLHLVVLWYIPMPSACREAATKKRCPKRIEKEEQMKRTISLDRGWQFGYEPFSVFAGLTGSSTATEVTLPHDYMIQTDIDPDAPAGPAMGYFTAKPAYYTRYIEIPADWRDERIYLHFDGIMMNATIEVNGSRVLMHHYGYTPVWADITHCVSFGKENRVTVAVNPSMQPNSRWYTGAGIFRSVELVHVPKLHIAGDGIFVQTTRIEYENGAPAEAYLRAEVTVCNHTTEAHIAQVDIALTRETSVLTRSTKIQVNAGSEAVAIIPVTVTDPALWDAEHPDLYEVTATVTDLGVFGCALRPTAQTCGADALSGRGSQDSSPVTDTASVTTGIRTVTADARHGLRVNGKPVKLRGGCIHHDNGILGAVSLYDSEYRKVRKLKESGFNLVRMAHNPPSAVLLDVCDRLGMYVFDEAFDAWRMAKQPGDYNQYFEADWKADMKAFLLRDRSHPSILFWSTGNEIVERGGLGDGYALAMELASYVRSIDSSRLITNGLCSFWNALDDETWRASMQNRQTGINAAEMAQNASVPDTDTFWEDRTEPFAGFLDVVGYNYMENHYELAGKLFPERVILGTESYPTEIDHVWDLVERLPYVIGDCTWTAFDYIGEAGIGKSVFADPDDPLVKAGPFGLMSHGSPCPWRLANDADFDINGNLTPQGAYRQIVWGSTRTALYVADPAEFGKTEVVSKWGWPALSDCWNWPQREGAPIHVVVYSAAGEVELFLNGQSLGAAAAGKEHRYTASFDISYAPGTLRAVSRKDGIAVSEDVLITTGAPAAIRLAVEPGVPAHDSLPLPADGCGTAGSPAADGCSSASPDGCSVNLRADGHSLAYIRLDIVDAEGRRVPDAAVALTAAVSGSGTLAGFGSANPVTAENYTAGSFTSFQGRALAVIRSGNEAGTVTLTVQAKGLPEASVSMTVLP